MRESSIRRIAMAVGIAGLWLGAGSANGALTFTLDKVINGSTPTSANPWLIATFKNNESGGVNLTLTSSLEVASEFISDVAFNVNPRIAPSAISVVNTTPANPKVTSVEKAAQNALSVTGGGTAGSGFDIKINWSTANNENGIKRFNNTDIEKFTFTFAGLRESDFNYVNIGSAHVHMAAHVQGIPGDRSGAIGDTVVPEPSTYIAGLLLAVPVLVNGARAVRRRRHM